jgi:ribosomal-protein-alanine N-acetyltransferase
METITRKDEQIELRYYKISDAKRFFEILNNPNFIYFSAKPKTIEEEIEFIEKSQKQIETNFSYGFTILYNGLIVGGCGIKINQHRPYIGEIGYFLDESYWNKGIVTRAVKMLEDIGFNELELKRIEIMMNPKNIASEKVAIKCGYNKEGTMNKVIKYLDEYQDAHLYAKLNHK